MAIDKRLDHVTRKYEKLSDTTDFLDTVLSHCDMESKRKSDTDRNYLDADRPMDANEAVD